MGACSSTCSRLHDQARAKTHLCTPKPQKRHAPTYYASVHSMVVVSVIARTTSHTTSHTLTPSPNLTTHGRKRTNLTLPDTQSRRPNESFCYYGTAPCCLTSHQPRVHPQMAQQRLPPPEQWTAAPTHQPPLRAGVLQFLPSIVAPVQNTGPKTQTSRRACISHAPCTGPAYAHSTHRHFHAARMHGPASTVQRAHNAATILPTPYSYITVVPKPSDLDSLARHCCYSFESDMSRTQKYAPLSPSRLCRR